MTLLLSKPGADVARDLAGGYAAGRTLRLMNYHSTPRVREPEYTRQLAELAPRYSPFRKDDLDRWPQGPASPKNKPWLMPILFEGFRDNYDVILPLLEDAGFTAWFFVPPHFLNVPVAEQRGFAEAHRLHYLRDEYPGERITMTWAEARDAAARGHVFACHSRNHTALDRDTPDDVLHEEIFTGKQEMEDGLGLPVDIFCWLHGADVGINPRADDMLRAAGFRYLFSNFRLQRLQ
ncbi:polysaccharide deacetylase [Aliiruegeria haliotis]|uniref:Chitooligosaccharide deacetylase n=1 Tax=Aliiruegeria haliotis TaxID=1280846 RepID=A0A2T0REJ8_9RHOB|nr:polysaccharide deacetylase family protein [Aliiruegeria haliotis]PRY19530.1 polysaccharide deacetylase [Aliiruegeria haliotis]